VTWLVPFVSAVSLLVTSALGGSLPPAAQPHGTWQWPVVGPVIRAFDPPDSPYGSGHRGIDIATSVGTPVRAPADGTVVFAGPVGASLFLTIDHGGGLESTCSWLSALSVRKGDVVTGGQVVAASGWGHPTEPVPHLHFGVKLDGVYVDPLAYLSSPSIGGLIRLAPPAT
jgi:murein DD-endopeptidase MepM/ murein hydrolase activator NlpD